MNQRAGGSRVFAVCVALAGCSADPNGSGRGEPVAPVANGGAQAGTSAGGPIDFGSAGTSTAVSPPVVTQPGGPPPPMGSSIEPVSIDQCLPQNPAGLSEADAMKLMAGSGDAGGMRLLYPYDGTVFPRGLIAPLLMWEGGDAEFVYVHIKATRFEYKGCLRPTAPGQLALPEDVWKTAGEKTLGPADPFALELTVMNGGVAKGPVREQIVIAQATVKGSIFYNSYSSQLPGGAGGSVLRIPAGGTAERFTAMECNGCHSVSVNGSRLLSQTVGTGARSFQLAPDTLPDPPSMMAGPRGAYGALYPDGSLYLATSVVIDVAFASVVQSFDAPVEATLYRTDDGSVVANSGIPTGALMPMFSPDGRLLAFNDNAIANAHGLALMDFDLTTNTATGHRVLYTDTAMRPGWPFFLPDNAGIVFTRTDGTNFSGEGAGIGGIAFGPSSELYLVDIATGTVTILARAMGYHTPDDAMMGVTYLPFGADELRKNYYPTVSPVAAGGYFWIFFDSLRHYGNQGLQRQLWGAAISITADGSYARDLSHPAFYLPGQEFGTGNHRAFAALDPCRQDGDSCTSGIDCCGGFCYVEPSQDQEFGSEPIGSCTSDVPMCAKTSERCASTADCCPPADGEPTNTCIGGFCAFIPVVD